MRLASEPARRGRWAAVALILAAPIAPLVRHPMLLGHDTYHHLVGIVATAQALRTGAFPLTWLPVLAGGMGAANPLYYCPAFFYLAGTLALAVGPALAMRSIAGAALVIAFLGTLVWTRRYHSPGGALLSATVFLYSPYFLADLYFRMALPELVALALLPWLMHFGGRVVERGGHRPLAATAMMVALMVLTHPPVALMGLALLAGLGLVLAGGITRPLGRLTLAVVAGLTISSAYWVPAVLDVPRLSIHMSGGHYDFHANFRAARTLFTDDWPLGQNDEVPFQVSRTALTLAFLGILSLPWVGLLPRASGRVHATMLIAAQVGLLLCTRVSIPVWDHVPLVRGILYPFRWLGPASLALAFVAPLMLQTAEAAWAGNPASAPARAKSHLMAPPPPPPGEANQRRTFSMVLHAPVIALIVAHGLRFCQGIPIGDNAPTPQAVRQVPQTAMYGENLYIPRGAALPPASVAPVAQILSGDGTVGDSSVVSGLLRARVHLRTWCLVRLSAYAFLGWRVTVDGLPTVVHADPMDKAMLIRLEPGNHLIEATFGLGTLRDVLVVAALGCLAFLFAPDVRLARSGLLIWVFAGLVAIGRIVSNDSAHSSTYAMERAQLALDDGDPVDHARWLSRAAGQEGPLAREARSRLLALGRGGLLEHVTTHPFWFLQAAGASVPYLRLRFPSPTWRIYTGMLFVPRSGSYGFAMRSDDGSYLYIDGHRVIANGGGHPPRTAQGAVDLSAGEHTMAILYFNALWTGELVVAWTPPGEYPRLLGPEETSPMEVPWLPSAIAQTLQRGP